MTVTKAGELGGREGARAAPANCKPKELHNPPFLINYYCCCCCCYYYYYYCYYFKEGTEKPKSQESKEPESQQANKPRSQEAKQPRSQQKEGRSQVSDANDAK